MHLFCFGLGYVAHVIANNLGKDIKISGTHSSPGHLKKNEYLFNDQVSFNNNILEDATHILISIPPTIVGDSVYLHFANYLKTLKKLQWIGYFSSSSVYGDHQGAWVDETSELKAFEDLGKNRLLAERQWLNSGLPVNILRLTGIYGLGRSVIETIKSGRASRIVKKDHYFSRIHVQDLALMTIAIMKNPKIGEIYNLADDEPAPNYQLVSFACELMNIEPPELRNFEDVQLSETMANYYVSSKRVSNKKIKNDYSVKLLYPSYREGLREIFSRL